MSDILTGSESVRSWRKRRGVILSSVTSDGTSGEDWISRLERKGVSVGYYAKSVLRSRDFRPTKGVTTDIVILPGKSFGGDDSSVSTVREFADEHELLVPGAELACLIREQFSDEEIEEMGFVSLLVMHIPIKDVEGVPVLLQATRQDGKRELVHYSVSGAKWQPDDYGLVYGRH